MTTAAAMLCSDGLVIATDTKATGGGIKWSENKVLTEGRLGQRQLVIAGAGRIRHIKDAVGWLGLDKLTDTLGENPSFDSFLAKIVEEALPQFARDFYGKYSEYPSVELVIGTIDKDETPRLVEIYANGDYDYKEKFAAIGSGSLFGEILLRKLYYPEITIAIAKRFLAYLIWEVQDIDNDSGEDMQVVAVSTDGKLVQENKHQIQAYKLLPFLVASAYDELKRRISSLNLPQLVVAVEQFEKEIENICDNKSTNKLVQE